jgi:hypothetical protein
MWTLLIIAVMVAGQSSGGHAVSTEALPMQSQEACIKAGNQIISHISKRQAYVSISAICVKDR